MWAGGGVPWGAASGREGLGGKKAIIKHMYPWLRFFRLIYHEFGIDSKHKHHGPSISTRLAGKSLSNMPCMPCYWHWKLFAQSCYRKQSAHPSRTQKRFAAESNIEHWTEFFEVNKNNNNHVMQHIQFEAMLRNVSESFFPNVAKRGGL